MSTSILFDVPGPKTRARHRLYAVISGLVVLGAIALAIWRLQAEGQFEYDLWEVFVTPFYMQAIGEAWLETLSMAVLAVIGAVVVGVLFGVGKLSDHRFVRWPCWLVVEIFRAIPVIMLMIFCFYAVFGGFDVARGAFWACVLGLTIYNGAVLAEVFRAGVLAVPKGQAEAAYAIGMGKTQVMTSILLPQAIKIMIPAIISQCVVALKDTSLILVVTGVGLTQVAIQLPKEFQNFVPVTIVITSLYVITNLVLTAIARFVQRKLVGEKKVLEVGVVGGVAEAGATRGTGVV